MTDTRGIVTVDLSGMRYTAAYGVVDGKIEISTGTSRITVMADDEPYEITAKRALERLLRQNPAQVPGIPIGRLEGRSESDS